MSEGGGNHEASTKSKGRGQVSDCRTVRRQGQIHGRYSLWSKHETSGVLSLDEA